MHRLSFCLSVLRVAWNRRAVSTQLRALSDHHLTDMGVERIGIDAYVRSCLPWPEAASAPRPAFSPSLQGCG